VEFAQDYYDEVALGIDFTARDVQNKLKAKGLPWEKAKGFDHSAAISAFIPLSELNTGEHNGVQHCGFYLEKNGEVMQSGRTENMIHTVDEIIAHVSEYFSLRIGDYIYTGTPEGVGPVKAGDHLKGVLAGRTLLDFAIR
jgi:2-keto-4-pentenoate hydratase/2-oxohepta-3-ene-1,7-dioic acid hydratase in catechol pathway